MNRRKFKETVDNLYYYANGGIYPKEMATLPEGEQDSFAKGYTTALSDYLVVELNMDNKPEKQQAAFLKGYYRAMQEILTELEKARYEKPP